LGRPHEGRQLRWYLFSPDFDSHQLCEEQGDELLEVSRGTQMAFR
jgi:hypothetical protein